MIMLPANTTKTTTKQERKEAQLSTKADHDDGIISTDKIHHDDSSTMGKSSVGSTEATEQSDFSVRKPTIQDEFKSKIVQPTNTLKKNKNVEEFTVNKLRFNSVGLLGRANEIRTLQACLDRTLEPNRRTKEIIMISGYSGTGKSALALEMNKKVNSAKRRAAFVAGKFNQYRSGEPLSAISEAFGKLCHKCMLLDDANERVKSSICEKISGALRSELKNEVHLLTRIIPNLNEMMTINAHDAAACDNINTTNSKARQAGLHFAIRVFIRIMSSYFSPLIICLDDLQWADALSLEIIELLLSDAQNGNSLMIIGCYRSNEVDGTHILSRTLRHLTDTGDESLYLTQINLGNLREKEVNQVIMALLSIDDDSRTKGLASICHKRTMGNPFFLLEFIKVLEKEGLLFFHLGLFQWKWNESNIEANTSSTKNVVHLLQVKMKKLPLEAQGFLQCAACLGSSFTLETMLSIWKHQTMFGTRSAASKRSTDELLDTMVKEEYLETPEIGNYRWAHDNVQQAASSLIDEESPASFRSYIGELWIREIDEDNLETCVFDIANLLNTITADVANIEYAKINLKAAEKAKNIAAFDSCSKYVSKGIDMLPENKWASCPDLTLKLFSLGAEAEGFLGHQSKMESYCNEVLSQKSISTLRKKDAYMSSIHSMAHAELRYEDAIDVSLDVLKSLGIRLPRGDIPCRAQAMVSLRRTVRMIKKTPVEVIDSLPVMTDPLKLATTEFIGNLGAIAFLSGKRKFALLAMLLDTRQVQTTLSHGLYHLSASSLAVLAMLTLSVLGDVDTALCIGEYALKMQEKIESEVEKARTTAILYNSIFPHVKTLQSSLKPYLEGYQSGMRTGNKTYAMWCLSTHSVLIPYMTGKPLKSIEEQCQVCVSQMTELKEEEQSTCTRIIWQLCLNLMGQSNATVELRGRAIDEKEDSSSVLGNSTFPIIKTIAYSLFGEYELGASQEISLLNHFELNGGHFITMMYMFHQALCLYAMAKKNRKTKKYKTRAKILRKKLTASFKRGNPNVVHYVCLLNAEHAAIDQKKDAKDVCKLYNDAIVISARGGYVNDAALAHERFADFLLSNVGDTDEAKYHIEEAIKCYTGWGAMRKVEHLREQYQGVLVGSSTT